MPAQNPTLNVRYPKICRSHASEAGNHAAGTITVAGRNVIFVRPRAYSNVQQVWPWAEGRAPTAAGAVWNAKIFASRTSSVAGAPVVSITPTPGSSTAFQYNSFSPNIADFLHSGQSLIQSSITEALMSVPVFDAMTSQAFRNIWNAATENQYLMFQMGTQRTDASAGDLVLGGVGLAIVQAPDTVNRTVTQIPMWDTNDGTTTTGADYEGSLIDAVPRRRRFRWRSAEFDNITAVRIVAFCQLDVGSPSGSVIFKLKNNAGTDIFTQTATIGSAVSNVGQIMGMFAFRSSDLKANLVDGEVYNISVNPSSALYWAGNSPSRCINIFLEVEQQTGFSRTTTVYTVRQGNSGYATSVALNQAVGGGDLFAPLHFANVANFVRPMRAWAMMRSDTGGGVNIQIRSNEEEKFESGRLCSYNASPALLIGAGGPTHSLVEITLDTQSSLDLPSGCIGDRKFYHRAVGAYGGGGATDSGTSGIFLAISYDVPTGLAPSLGNLFDVGDFNPIGCVSTAAGGGTPGILIIGNGSAIPKKFDPQAGLIQDAGIPRPFPDEVPDSSNIVVDNHNPSPSGVGLTAGSLYTYAYTFRNCCTGKESNPSSIFQVSTVGAAPAAKVTISFAGVVISGDDQICEICIYRTVADGAYPSLAKVGCFDPSVTTTFVDTLGDSQLDFINDFLSELNAPPPCVPYLVSAKRRIFGAGDIPIANPAGTVSVQNGSNIVEGDFDVEWDRCLENRYIQVQGDCRKYQIRTVMNPAVGTSPAIQRLELYEEYDGTSAAGKLYTICGDANTVFYSEPEEPEYWPVVNQFPVEPGDGDFITMLGSSYDRLIIAKRTKTYVADYREVPALEIVDPSRISPDIGCVGSRTFTQVENWSVWLADRGIALFDGRGVQHLPVSDGICDIFIDPENPRYMRRNRNGLVPEAVAVNYPVRQQVWLGIPTIRGNRGFDCIVVWDYKENTTTLYEFCNQFVSMVVAKDSEGNPKVYLGDDKGFVWVADTGHSDGVGTPGNTGTVAGTSTEESSDTFSLTDSNATFIEGGIPGLGGLSGVAGLSPFEDNEPLGLAGSCVYFEDPDGDFEAADGSKWIKRVLWAATKQKLYYTPPSATPLPEGTRYVIGAINWFATFKPTSLQKDSSIKRTVDLFVVHVPEEFDSQVKIECFPDFATEDEREGAILSTDDATPNGRTVLMSNPKGSQIVPLGRIVSRYMGYRLSNFAPEQPIRLLNLVPTMEERP